MDETIDTKRIEVHVDPSLCYYLAAVVLGLKEGHLDYLSGTHFSPWDSILNAFSI